MNFMLLAADEFFFDEVFAVVLEDSPGILLGVEYRGVVFDVFTEDGFGDYMLGGGGLIVFGTSGVHCFTEEF